MDDCENLVINLEEYEALELKLQHQQHELFDDNELELLELTTALDTEEIMVNLHKI